MNPDKLISMLAMLSIIVNIVAMVIYKMNKEELEREKDSAQYYRRAWEKAEMECRIRIKSR